MMDVGCKKILPGEQRPPRAPMGLVGAPSIIPPGGETSQRPRIAGLPGPLYVVRGHGSCLRVGERLQECLMRLQVNRVLPSLVAGLIVVPGALGLHAHLTGSYPAKEEVLTAAPRYIQLTFSEKTEVAVSDIKVLGADSAAVRM